LTSDPNRSSLGLLPSGPDPVGEWLVHRQPPAPYIGGSEGDCKRAGRLKTAEDELAIVDGLMKNPSPPAAVMRHPRFEQDATAIEDPPLTST